MLRVKKTDIHRDNMYECVYIYGSNLVIFVSVVKI